MNGPKAWPISYTKAGGTRLWVMTTAFSPHEVIAFFLLPDDDYVRTEEFLEEIAAVEGWFLGWLEDLGKPRSVIYQ